MIAFSPPQKVKQHRGQGRETATSRGRQSGLARPLHNGWIIRPSVQALPRPEKGSFDMLRGAIIFFVIALVAAALGFGGIAGDAAGIAKILFVVFLVVALVSLVLGRRSIV